jgi:predicted nucleic acid-binding Zn finger protein
MLKKIEDTQLCKEIVRVNQDWYYVASSEEQICYKVMVSEDGREYCSCEDYARNMKSDPILKCRQVMAVINAIRTGKLQDIDYLPSIKPVLDERFITNIQDKDFVVYAGLLDLAHQMGLKKLEVNPIQYPTKENDYEAICTAIAQTKDGVFSDIGDANPSNCHKMVSKHILRMASTRAKARVLRDMTNVGMTCLEELGDLNEYRR